MHGLAIERKLNLKGTSKIIGFRYPLNRQEKINIKVYDGNNNLIDLRGIIIVYEYMLPTPIDKIAEYLKSKGQNHDRINPTIRSKIIYGVSSIMKQLHENGVIHRYLTCDNVFLDEHCEPILSGFYLAKVFYSDLDNTMAIGSPLYMAPEMFMDDETYGLSVDVFAYGKFLYRMFSSFSTITFPDHRPFRSLQQYMMRISKGQEDLEHYWDLIQRCWEQDPLDRPTFDEIVEILKDNKFALNEFGMKTNLDQLHEYQRRIDNQLPSEKKPSSAIEEENEKLRKELKELKEKVSTLESILSLPKEKDKPANCFIGIDDEEFHQILSKIGEGATSVAYKVVDSRTGRIMCKKVLKINQNDSNIFKTLQNALKEFQVLYDIDHPCICKVIGINTSEPVSDPNI